MAVAFARWHETPLYLRIIGALLLGIVTGTLLGERASALAVPSQLILRLLGALAPPLILLAVIDVLMTTEIEARTAGRLAGLLLLNTVVAIVVGLAVANVVRPGTWSRLEVPKAPSLADAEEDASARSTLMLLEKH